MTTTVNLRQVLDQKTWEACAPCPTTNGIGLCVVATPPRWPVPHALFNAGSTSHYLYDPRQNSFLEIPSGTLGSLAAGTCGAFHPMGPTGTASAGGALTITTTLTIPGDLNGYTIRLTGGTGAGQERVISRNTAGANSVITTTAVWGTNPDNTTTYVILSGRFWFLSATGGSVTWKYYDIATNAWVSKSVTSGPGAAFGTDGACVATSGALQTATIATGTATLGGGSTLTNAGKSWTTNQWANFQVRITSGTGAGQVRTINSNTGTVLTVSAAWGTNPDATSVYVIEGNDDWLYVVGNSAVTMFRYAINGIAGLSANAQATGDTWITVAPGTARSIAPGAGCSLSWVSGSTDARMTDETAIINGRRLYSFRGAISSTLDYYDIPSNAWTSAGVTYQRAQATFTTGSSWAEHLGVVYGHKDATGRFFRFDAARNVIDPLAFLNYSQGTAVVGAKTFLFSYMDGATEILWIYNWRNSGTELFRMLLI